MNFLGVIRDDIRFAVRQMNRSPMFTLVAALTLALGIGANSAIFAFADAILLRPLPFPSAERLVLVEEFGPRQLGRSRIELLNIRDWRAANRTFEAMAGVWIPADNGGPEMMGADGTAETIPSQTVTSEFFDVFGVTPIAGRTFLTSDESPTPGVVVLSEGFWRRRFNADPALIGRDITLDGNRFTVIGVVPTSFQFVRPSGLWTLLPLPRASEGGTTRGQCGSCRFLQAIGRLKPATSVDAAQSDLTRIADSLAVRNGETSRPRQVIVASLRDVLIGGDLRTTSLLLLGVVGIVLLLCCATVANLMLARATARMPELAMRSALGAGRQRVVAQLLTENLVLAALGGISGPGVGAAILEVAPGLMPPGLLPSSVSFGFDGRVAMFCAATAFFVGALFSIAPAWRAAGTSLVEVVGSQNRAATTRDGHLRRLLVAGEVAVAVFVLCVAGLLLRTLLELNAIDHGYRAANERVLTATVELGSTSRYPDDSSLLRFYDAVEREVAIIPGVQSASWATTLPLGGSQLGGRAFEVVGEETRPGEDRPLANYQIVSPSYFQTVELSVVAGRPFTERDTSNSVPVSIVNEAFVTRHLRGRNPIGLRIRTAAGDTPVIREIVGVARQVKERPDEAEEMVQIYIPNAQSPWPEAFLLVRTSDTRASAVAPTVRQAVARVDRLLPLDNLVTLEDVATAATARHEFRATLVVAFAGLALLLAMVGVFGVLMYSVESRWREFAVRQALGAVPAHVLKLVLASATQVTVLGAAAGLLSAAAFSESLRAFLFNVEPLDPLTFVVVPAVVVLAAGAASMVPALRATRVDPAIVFRRD